MTLVQETNRLAAASFVGRRVSDEEGLLRTLVENWGRDRFPESRVVHELTVGRGQARADMAFIQHNSFASVEIKSSYDTTERVIHQCGMFRLVSPEIWLVVTDYFEKQARLVRYLMPSIGVIVARSSAGNRRTPDTLDIIHEPVPFRPDHESMLLMLWASELANEMRRAGLIQGAKHPPCKKMVERLLETLSPDERVAAVCRQLRARDAVWRADPPIYEGKAVQS